MFSTRKIISAFVNLYDIISLFVAEWEEPKIGMLGKGLTHYHTMPHFDTLEIYSCGKREKSRNYL